MIITDGKKTYVIRMRKWDGSGWGPDFANDYCNAGLLPFDEDRGVHIVEDADDFAEGARDIFEEDFEGDDDMLLVIDELENK